MNRHAFDTVARQARGMVTRRASLLTLGGAALAATVANPGVSVASGGGFRKKLKERCDQNKIRCVSLVPASCNDDPGCIALTTPCCDECFSGGFLDCIQSIE